MMLAYAIGCPLAAFLVALAGLLVHLGRMDNRDRRDDEGTIARLLVLCDCPWHPCEHNR